MTAYVPRNHLKTNTIEGAPSIVRLPKKIKPEDISMDDLRHLSSDSFALWTQTAGVEVDGNAVDFDMHRYLLPIYMCNDTEIVWQKAAQMGATIYMLLKVIHWLNAHPGRKAGLYFPTKEGVENLSKDRLTPLLGSIKDLETSIDKEDKLGLRKIGKSSFYLFHLGGTASKDSVPLDFVAFDEVRLCRPADIDQAMERISHSIYKQKILMSTCHRGDTRIIVRKKVDIKHWQVSTPPVSMSFEELKSCWQDYQALCYYSSDGANYTYRNITAFHDNGVKEVVKATFDDGTEVVSTPNHEFAWCDSTGNICWDSLAMLHKNGTHILSNAKASRIVNLEPVEPTEVYDIAVDQYHNYVLENGAVAHNCGMPSSDIAARFDLGSQHVWMAKCFTGSTEIWVKHKVTNEIQTLSFDQLKHTWKEYQALGVATAHKDLYWRDITHFHENGMQPVVNVNYKNGTTVTTTPNHEFAWVSTKTFDTISYAPIGEVLKPYRYGKYDRNNLLTVGHVKDNHEQQVPYDNLTLALVGAYIAEGSWKAKNTINIAQLEGKHLHTLAIDWAKANNLTYNATAVGVDIGLFSRPDLVELFTACGKGCENKQVPALVKKCSGTQAKYLLDAYISGDGSRHELPMETRHTYRRLELLLDTAWDATTTSPTLVKDLQELCLRAGYPTSVRSNSVKEGHKPAWTVGYHPRAVMRVSDVNKDLYTTYITEVIPAGVEAVYDITVDAVEERDHNFVLANGAVVHNCHCPDGCDLARTFPACVVDDKRRNKLYLRCPKCKYTINDPQNGRYVPHNPGADYTSFHVSQLTSKYMPLKVLWDFYHRTTNKAEFFNAKLGLPYIDEENRGVGLSQLRSCVDTSLQWASPGQTNTTAMGVDVGGGYCYVFIADLHGDKKRIRHVEIIESENPNYMENGKRVTPFKRLRELMREYKVQMCVVDAMPNYDMVIEFAQEFPGKVFASFYAKEAKDVVSWSDRPKVKAGIKKAGPLLKFKYYCVLSRFLSLDVALSQWANQEVICPDPDQLVQMCFKENSKDLNPEAPMTRAFSMFMRLIKRYNITNEETGEGRHEWIYSGGDPHFAHAWNYCNVALERLRRSHSFTFL